MFRGHSMAFDSGRADADGRSRMVLVATSVVVLSVVMSCNGYGHGDPAHRHYIP